jgi:hypothetical protein
MELKKRKKGKEWRGEKERGCAIMPHGTSPLSILPSPFSYS